jgi:threonine dehydratase
MKTYGITAGFRQLGESGPCLVDATQNETHAYKLRGALASTFCAVQSGAQSIWTASAGNHGAGVALAAKLLDVSATVYVPLNAPVVKVEKIKSFGATVIRTGNSFDTCLENARSCEAIPHSQSAFIHPFDDNIVVAGQGTIGLEILDHITSHHSLSEDSEITVFVPIGGGGLAAGITSTLMRFWPKKVPVPRIVGVVDEGVPASVLGTLFGRPISSLPTTIADGTRVAKVGQAFLEVAPLMDSIMLVPHDAIVSTMQHFYREHNEVLEASGALALTGEYLTRKYNLLDYSDNSVHYAVLSGRNIDANTFQEVVSESQPRLPALHRRVAFDIRIPEQDGELLRFLRAVKSFNISSLTYKQQESTCLGTLRAEFEVAERDAGTLFDEVFRAFPGSCELDSGAQLILPVTSPVAQSYRDLLVSLEDRPGSFLRYIEEMANNSRLGSVGFLYYRKPTADGALPQVVIGLSE